MAKALMILGTHSNAGKSLIATAFCRLFARRGYKVAPFKAQNISNNAGVTAAGAEIGRAQIVQAEAAGIEPHADMNPLLLKPEGDRRSQIVLNGRVWGHIDAHNWRQIKGKLWSEVRAAYDRLATRYDLIVLEGAGSPAEPNLKDGDIVNLNMARHAHAPCLLVGDIDRGGVFAALAGTMLLLDPSERTQIKGFLINKFRGDAALLGSALNDLQQKAYGVPTLGVVPFIPDLRIADEDAVALETRVLPTAVQTYIAVVQLPHIANFDDFAPLANEGIAVRYVREANEIEGALAIVLPGTKATLADLQWLRERGLDTAILRACASGVPVVGICGGYQMLGRTLADPLGIETSEKTTVAGLGLLGIETRFTPQKETHQTHMLRADGTQLKGYEIHMGETTLDADATPFATIVARGEKTACTADGAISADQKIWGTYMHGLFANATFRQQWLAELGCAENSATERQDDYERLADALEASLQWPQLMRILDMQEDQE
jgi:adenosylcobyric acid synthase